MATFARTSASRTSLMRTCGTLEGPEPERTAVRSATARERGRRVSVGLGEEEERRGGRRKTH